VANPKAGDRRVVGDPVGADNPEGDVLAAAALDPPRASLPGAVGVGEQGEHHLRIVRRSAVAVGAVGGVERLEVEFVDRLDHEPGEVILRQPVAEIRRQEQGLAAVAGEEVLSHGSVSACKRTEKRAQPARVSRGGRRGLRDTLTRKR
jgi:hypothetical protein